VCAPGNIPGGGGDNPASTQYFVRTDGGTYAQCNGLTDAAYTGGDNSCAVNHIFELLDPETNTVRIAGGDIVNIASGSYEMGSHGDYTSGDCSSLWAYDCFMPAIPSGTQDKPTIIRGGDSSTCTDPTDYELWGSGRASRLMNLDGTDHVELRCMTLTDHSSCVSASQYPDATKICQRGSPYNKPFADIGVYVNNASDVEFVDLDIQGLQTGIKAGTLSGDITLTRVNLYANHSAGWNQDISPVANNGTISFIDSQILFSGYGLIYDPAQPDHLTPWGSANQSIGGYGDGLGTESIGGDWVFDNTLVMHNNSDGIDLLYHELGGKITIHNSRIEGNGGNQVKVSGNTEVVNNIISGNCAWNDKQTYVDDANFPIGANGENCRALGTALSISYAGANDKAVVLNNSIFSEGDCIMSSSDRTSVGQSSQEIHIVNNMFYSVPDHLSGDVENSCMYYEEPGEEFPIQHVHNNVIHMAKSYGTPCTNFPSNVPSGDNADAGSCTSAGVVAYFDDSDHTVVTNPRWNGLNQGIVYTAYDPTTLDAEANDLSLQAGSPLIDAGYRASVGGVTLPTTDYLGNPRDANIDIGAMER